MLSGGLEVKVYEGYVESENVKIGTLLLYCFNDKTGGQGLCLTLEWG